MITQEQVRRLNAAFSQDIDPFLAIGEEGGEVIGAYCKWKLSYGGKDVSDILEEMGQLVGCVFTAALHVGLSAENVLASAESWMTRKAEKLEALR